MQFVVKTGVDVKVYDQPHVLPPVVY
jgi:hypothetical protein